MGHEKVPLGFGLTGWCWEPLEGLLAEYGLLGRTGG